MARKLRVEYPGAIYHVMNRGDRRKPIFRDDETTRIGSSSSGLWARRATKSAGSTLRWISNRGLQSGDGHAAPRNASGFGAPWRRGDEGGFGTGYEMHPRYTTLTPRRGALWGLVSARPRRPDRPGTLCRGCLLRSALLECGELSPLWTPATSRRRCSRGSSPRRTDTTNCARFQSGDESQHSKTWRVLLDR
jgi:hypothetical protein